MPAVLRITEKRFSCSRPFPRRERQGMRRTTIIAAFAYPLMMRFAKLFALARRNCAPISIVVPTEGAPPSVAPEAANVRIAHFAKA
jgi:hypothetical protein